MYPQSYNAFALLWLACLSPCALASPQPRKKVPSDPGLPFNQLVAFGDQFVDNGNGSYAHGLDPGNIYNYYTWTDGYVVPTYLASALGVPLVDFAWGGWFGGGLAGATLDNDYTPAKDQYNGNPVPSTLEQINNYTSGPVSRNIENALQFIWAGQNDLKKHTNWYAADPDDITTTAKTNVYFYGNFTSLLLSQAETLIKQGAPGVVVLNLMPYQTCPASSYFFCHFNETCSRNWGKVIEAANSHLEAGLAASSYADKIIYYDVYNYMRHIMANKDSYGYTASLLDHCDGNFTGASQYYKWQICIQDKWATARPYFWFTNDNMETTVHQYIANDIQKVVAAHFAKDSSKRR